MIGSPPERNGTPWNVVGRKPLDHNAAPPRGPRGPDCNTTNPGRSVDSLPIPYVTHEPMDGGPNWGEPVLKNTLAGPWLNTVVATDRTKATSSTIPAMCGRHSDTQVPVLPCRANLRAVPRSLGRSFENVSMKAKR